MKSLYVRVWITLVVLLGLFALASGYLFQRQFVQERGRMAGVAAERLNAWADLIQRSLPPADAEPTEQANALREWSQRLRVPMALDDAKGTRIGASDSYVRRSRERDERERTAAQDGGPAPAPPMAIKLDDGRTLWVLRFPQINPAPMPPGPGGMGMPRWWPWRHGVSLAALLGLLFLGVAVGAYPVVRRLTRRLESLKEGVEQFGSGTLSRRVSDEGSDEVAAVGRSFNQAAARIESLVISNQSLLANASHELRSPLARMKMAVSMLDDDLPLEQRNKLLVEIHTNITELDALVDEVLLASRLDAQVKQEHHVAVDLHTVLLEEGARVSAQVGDSQPGESTVQGDERLLRRAVRNLLENARRYGGGAIEASLVREGKSLLLKVADRGPGVPREMQERIFEPFFRMPGHAEKEGGVGLGLSLVRQIAQRHGGSVRCQSREGGGSLFVFSLPLA